jgi:fucose 4-O-acetylase-like acetyltransferase
MTATRRLTILVGFAVGALTLVIVTSTMGIDPWILAVLVFLGLIAVALLLYRTRAVSS